MNAGETPQISSMMYASATAGAVPLTFGADWERQVAAEFDKLDADHPTQRRPQFGQPVPLPKAIREIINVPKEGKVATRLVKVFIVDPEESLNLEDRLLYKSDEFLTDSSDTELYFDIDIKGLLAKHNEKRLMTIDKKTAKGAEKPQRLEAARVRDLKMQVIVLAQF